MTSIVTELFTEKFRPKNLNQLIAPKRIKDELSKGLIQNILLYGNAGVGKTSSLFILSQGHPFLYINASSERGIDTVRENISNFCSTISLEGGKENLKCVILDEIEGATQEFFTCLRAQTERFASTTRFIASCNYLQKVPEPIQSRFHLISFDPLDNEEEIFLIGEYKKRCAKILDALQISYDDKILTDFIKYDFPDMRSILQKLQSFHTRGIKELNSSNFNINFDFKDLFDLCISKPNPLENYKFITTQYSNRIDDALVTLGKDFPQYLQKNLQSKLDKLPLIIIAIAEYQYQKAFVIDPIITLLAAIYKIQIILNEK